MADLELQLDVEDLAEIVILGHLNGDLQEDQEQDIGADTATEEFLSWLRFEGEQDTRDFDGNMDMLGLLLSEEAAEVGTRQGAPTRAKRRRTGKGSSHCLGHPGDPCDSPVHAGHNVCGPNLGTAQAAMEWVERHLPPRKRLRMQPPDAPGSTKRLALRDEDRVKHLDDGTEVHTFPFNAWQNRQCSRHRPEWLPVLPEPTPRAPKRESVAGDRARSHAGTDIAADAIAATGSDAAAASAAATAAATAAAAAAIAAATALTGSWQGHDGAPHAMAAVTTALNQASISTAARAAAPAASARAIPPPTPAAAVHAVAYADADEIPPAASAATASGLAAADDRASHTAPATPQRPARAAAPTASARSNSGGRRPQASRASSRSSKRTLCWASELVQVQQFDSERRCCPNGHALSFSHFCSSEQEDGTPYLACDVENEQRSVECDRRDYLIREGDAMWSCVDCEYDVCDACCTPCSRAPSPASVMHPAWMAAGKRKAHMR